MPETINSGLFCLFMVVALILVTPAQAEFVPAAKILSSKI